MARTGTRGGERPRLVVVGETPSLASALVDLLRSEGLAVGVVRDVREAAALPPKAPSAPRLFISASNSRHCETADRWQAGWLEGTDLIVVGTRDPDLRSEGRLHIVPLPLIPAEFLALVRSLLEGPPAPTPRRTRRAPLQDARAREVALPRRPPPAVAEGFPVRPVSADDGAPPSG